MISVRARRLGAGSPIGTWTSTDVLPVHSEAVQAARCRWANVAVLDETTGHLDGAEGLTSGYRDYSLDGCDPETWADSCRSLVVWG